MLGLNSFQVIFLAVLIVLFSGTVFAVFRNWATRKEGFFWGLLCLSAAVATIWPDLTGRLAKGVGIGRGADLVFYCAVAVMMVGFWMTYMRLWHLRHEMTTLVRHIAILEAERGELEAGSSSEDAPFSGISDSPDGDSDSPDI